jgi:hypothetical protein
LDVDISQLKFDGVVIPSEFCNLEVQVTFAGYFDKADPRFCALTGKKLR